MIPELGQLALVLALGMAIFQVVVPLAGTLGNRPEWMATARPLSWAQFFFLVMAFGCLVQAFATDDFSVSYVANHSNSMLPPEYKISAVWGGHEGSLLLWALILSGWGFAVSIFSRSLPPIMVTRVLSVMGMISIGFLLFILMTSNPFLRLLPFPPTDGGDLNPLLQDFGLIVHPPMLYMGYVGFSVAFAFAIAALMGGRLDAAWARWSRPWTTVAWCFLTLGIALGSWWAYYELGWGGWWFWDPVENASLMPWLAGTALVHSLAVTEKRGVFKSWTVLLAIMAFSLSLLGTFLVRSGVLTSVHAFATDPARGVFILVFLMIVIGGSLTLYALKAPVVRSHGSFGAVSRETLLLVNNVLLTVALAVVLLGTLFPLFYQAIWNDMLSVGPSYFNMLFVPLCWLAALALPVGVIANWKKSPLNWMMKQLLRAAVVSVILGLVASLVVADNFNWSVLLSMVLVFWIVASIVMDLHAKTRNKPGLFQGLATLKPSLYGMHIAHLGIAVCIVGAVMTTTYSKQVDIRLAPGEMTQLGDFSFRFVGVERASGPNYLSDFGTVKVYRDEKTVATLNPEKRLYKVQGQVMSEPGIRAGLFEDLYVALGERMEDGSWAVRLHVKPFVRWIWLGAILMTLGGFVTVADRRYRVAVKKRVPKKRTAAKDGLMIDNAGSAA